ncbi:MAG: DMT family transporter [Kiloniellales bacterium]
MSEGAASPRSGAGARGLDVAAPGLFVVLWSSGFIGARLGLPYAEPFTFLALRFAIASALMLALALLLRARLTTLKEAGHVAVVGLLVHAVYLGAAFFAMGRGLPAGLTALIVCLQPLLTAALVGPLLGESVTRRQVVGLVLGLAGVALALSEKFAPGGARLFQGFDLWAPLASFIAMIGMTFGLIYQKRHCANVDLMSGAAVQYLAACAAMLPLVLLFEGAGIQWSGEFLFALGWLVLVLSVGAVSLLMVLVRRGAAAKTASLFYLVPPVTAVMAFFLFDERLGWTALAGLALAAFGVALAISEGRALLPRRPR